jgi:hypothetical protein
MPESAKKNFFRVRKKTNYMTKHMRRTAGCELFLYVYEGKASVATQFEKRISVAPSVGCLEKASTSAIYRLKFE